MTGKPRDGRYDKGLVAADVVQVAERDREVDLFLFLRGTRQSRNTRRHVDRVTVAWYRGDAIFMMLKFGNVRKQTLSQHENSVQLRHFFDRVLRHPGTAVADERRDLRRAVLDAVDGAAEADPDDVVRAQPARSLEIGKKTTHVHHSRRRRV